VYSPKAGWRRAAYTPEKTFTVPSGIELKSLMTSNGYGLVTADNGMPIYRVKAAPQNPAAWTPVYAPLLASKVGEFNTLKRPDGKLQWAYKGEALYTFNQDYSQSDINGTLADKGARIALAYRHFMPESVRIGVYPLRGPLMTTQTGATIYTETRYHLQYGGREMREGYRYTYLDAKGVGVRGCVDECAKTWTPLEAPKGAQSAGFWEAEVRPDGSKQWAYRGSLLYTYAGDQAPGEIKGNNRHDILYGDMHGKVLYGDSLAMGDIPATGGDKDPRYNEGAGFYWHVAGLYN
jgi:predicted lipoprotein with Yx(FWY)xxD motif